MDYGFFTGGDDDLDHACPMQRCGGPGSNQGNGRVVEQTWLPGFDCQIGQ